MICFFYRETRSINLHINDSYMFRFYFSDILLVSDGKIIMAQELSSEQDNTGRLMSFLLFFLFHNHEYMFYVVFNQTPISVGSVDVKARLIDHYFIHVYVMEVFDSYMMTGRPISIQRD